VLRDAGARMTVGPYWRVDKVHSVDVAKGFFEHVLVDNWTIGAAMREVRANPRPPTKTAYTLVGDPTMRVRVV
jgi:hypothetical protein